MAHCIEVECSIPLTAAFIQVCLAALGDAQTEETQRFRRLYGDAHWKCVLAWFERATEENAT